MKVLAVDSVSGSLLSSVHHSDADSIDGNISLDGVANEQFFEELTAHASSGASNNGDGLPGHSQHQGNFLASTNSGISPQVILVDVKDKNSLLGKRPASGIVSQTTVANKIIITKHTQQTSQSVPMQIGNFISVPSQSANVLQVTSGAFSSPQTPTKTITISQHGIVSPVKGVVTMTQVAGTPPKVAINKVSVSPARTPTKITMIPRSPQRIAPAGNMGLNVNNSSVNVSASTITLSPSKIIKHPGTVTVVRKLSELS